LSTGRGASTLLDTLRQEEDASRLAEKGEFMPLIILTQTPTDPVAFVDFWARQYHDPNESLYTDNINMNRTRESLCKLFEWKANICLTKHFYLDMLGS
jgi:hypothetical protein